MELFANNDKVLTTQSATRSQLIQVDIADKKVQLITNITEHDESDISSDDSSIGKAVAGITISVAGLAALAYSQNGAQENDIKPNDQQIVNKPEAKEDPKELGKQQEDAIKEDKPKKNNNNKEKEEGEVKVIVNTDHRPGDFGGSGAVAVAENNQPFNSINAQEYTNPLQQSSLHQSQGMVSQIGLRIAPGPGQAPQGQVFQQMQVQPGPGQQIPQMRLAPVMGQVQEGTAGNGHPLPPRHPHTKTQ